MVAVKSSQKLFTDEEISRLTGICMDHLPGVARSKRLGSKVAIDAQGGLIWMQTAVRPGQRLLVTNEANERMQECLVIFADTRLARGIAVAFRFSTPVSKFWHNLEIGKTSLPSVP